VAILISIVRPVLGQSRSAAAFTINLRDYGWEPKERGDFNVPAIAIDGQNRILLAFTIRERTGLVTRNEASRSQHIVRFTPEGEVNLSLSLPTNAGGVAGIYLSDNNQIIARANDNLQLLRLDEGSAQKASWTSIAPCALLCRVAQSHSRRTLLLFTERGDPVTLIRLSDKPTLERCGKEPQLISPEDKIQNYPEGITDEYAYFRGEETGVESGLFTYRWPLCDYGHRVEIPLRIGGRWLALNDDAFVVDAYSSRTGDWGVSVVSSDGEVKFRPTLLKHESARTLRGSERGNRIAVEVLTLCGGSRTLDISSHITARRIAVYDIAAGKELASIPVSPKHRYGFKFDLSPDGHRLAILEDDVVRVIDLEVMASLTSPR